MDNEHRLQLETLIERGQQAKVALSFFDGFEDEQKRRLWAAAQKSDAQMMAAIGHIALTVGAFKDYLTAAISDGKIAEKDLQMEEIKNG